MRRILTVGILVLASALSAVAQINQINTVAGGGKEPATASGAYLPEPFSAVRDKIGNTYISVPTLYEVFKVDTSGNLTVYAGTGNGGFSGDGGAATSAQLSFPEGLAIDGNGNLFIADFYNERIRRVDATTHIITTVAGSEDPFFGNYGGDGGPATNARLNGPEAVAVDANDNLFIADTNNGVVRRVDATTGNITTYAGNISATAAGCPSGSATATGVGFGDATGVAVDASGNVFVSDMVAQVVCKVTTSQTISVYAGTLDSPGIPGQPNGDGGAATSAKLLQPRGLTTDPTGNLYIADAGNPKIRKVTASTGVISTVAGIGLICANAQEPACGDGGAATSAEFNFPENVFYDSLGNLVVTDTDNMRVRVVSGSSTIAALAGGGSGGDGGAGTSGIMGLPQYVAVDSSENVYALESNGERLREVTIPSGSQTGNLSTVAGDGFGGATIDCNGTSCGSANNGDGGVATAARFVFPTSLAIDANGNYYILDYSTASVRMVNKQSTSITVAGVTIQSGDIATIAGNGASCGTSGNPNTRPLCGDGGAATSASLFQPYAIAVDANGIVYIGDAGLSTVRAVNTGTSATTIAGVQIAAGDIATIAGTPGSQCSTYLTTGCGIDVAATSATLSFPIGLAVSGTDLYIADSGDNVVRDVSLETGTISQYAFNGLPSFGGDDGFAQSASMNGPSQLALDNRGNLYITGGSDNVVRRVDAGDQTVVTVAGDVNNLGGGFSGDGGPSTAALIGDYGIAIFNTTTPTDDLFIGDTVSNRVRRVNLAPVTIADPSTGATVTFGPALAGRIGTAPQDISFANDGLDDLILSAKVTGTNATAFVLPASNGPGGTYVFQVSPGNANDLIVNFNPPAGSAGTLTATLTITTNDKANPTLTYPLSGTVGAPATLNVTISPAGLPTSPGSVASTDGTILCPSTCSGTFPLGSTVTLVAEPATGFAFQSWNVGNAPEASNCSTDTTGFCTFTITASGETVNAVFTTSTTSGTYTITVVGLGNGSGTVTGGVAGGAQINCTITNGVAGSTGCVQTFSSVTSPKGITLTSTASTGGSVFVGYLGECTVVATATNECTTLPITSTVASVFSGPPVAFSSGQVFLDLGPMVFVLNPSTGAVVQVLGEGTNPAGEGMTFDSVGNLNIANVAGYLNVFSKLAAGPTTVGNYGGDNEATSVVFDPSGNAYVAEEFITSDQQPTLLEYAAGSGPTSQPTGTFYPAFLTQTVNNFWIELLESNDTIAYTLANNVIKVFDVGEQNQHPDIVPNPALTAGEALYALRELPDTSLLAAATDRIIRVSQTGTIVKSYTAGTGAVFQNLNLDPDGATFWTNDQLTGTVYRINLSSGAVVSTFTTNLGFSGGLFTPGISGIAVFGQPQSGGADVAVTMTAPASVTQNSNVTYTATVVNNGPLAATNVNLTDALPAGATLVSTTSPLSPGGICAGSTTLTCSLGTMASGALTTITIVVTATQTGTLTNTVNVTSGVPDPNQTNNSATTNTTVTSSSPVSLHVTMAGTAEGTVTDNLGQINCQETGAGTESGTCNAVYSVGTQVTFTASTPGAFGGFSGSPASCTGTGLTCQVTMTASSETVTATFNPGTSTFPLTVQAGSTHTGGGTITSTPTGINCTIVATTTSGTCTASFGAGEFVTMNAAAGSGSTFFGWTGTTPTCITSSAVSCLVAMTAAETVEAGFTSGGGTVSVTVTGAGNVEDKTNPTSINCTNTATGPQSGACSAGYALGSAVTLTETPASGATFVSWGGGVCANPNATTCTFTVTTATTFAITATFQSGTGGGLMFTSTALPGGAVGVPYGTDIQSLVNGGTPPYTVALQSGSSLPTGFTLETPNGTGNVAQGHIFNDSPATAGTFTFGVTVTDSSSPAQVVNATLSVTIAALPNTQAALLTGQYAVEIVAYPDCGASGNNCPTGTSTEALFLGSLTFDGKGGVTGVMDANTSGTGVQQEVAVTGTYTVGPDNRGFLTIPSGVGGTGIHAAFSVGTVYRGVAYSARITGFRDDDGNHGIGAGFMQKQDPTAFTQASFAGTYVYGVSGQGPTGVRSGIAGLITFDNALHVVSGSEDVNEGGNLGSFTSITGSYTAPDANGRTVLSLTLTNSTKSSNSTVAVYIVSANQVIPMNLDTRANNDLETGLALRQANPGSFTASSLAGPDVLSLNGVASGGGTFAGVGLLSVSSGTLTVKLDRNDGGNVLIGDVATGTAPVAANGRVPFSVTDTTTQAKGAGVIYLEGQDSGFVLIADSSVALGSLTPQVGGPFSGTSFTGNVYFGQQEAVSGAGSEFSGASTSVASGTFNATNDNSHRGGDLLYGQNAGSITYAVDSTGHVTGQVTIGSNITGYLVNPSEVAIFDTTGPASDPTPSAHPNLIIFQTIAAPKGTPSPASTSVNFPTAVAIGSSAQSSPITITNTGLGPLGISGVGTPPDFSFASTSTCLANNPEVLQPGQSCNFVVTFAPSSSAKPGAQLNETITATTDGTANISITATGTVASSGPAPALAITKTHTGSFTVSQTGTYTVTVSNGANAGLTSGTVTVTENLPAAIGVVNAMAGTGWTCQTPSASVCVRSNALPAGASYPPITVTVKVASTVPGTPQANSVTVSGGGSASATTTDPTTLVLPSTPMATLNPANGSTLAFGNQAENVQSNSKPVTLTNTGTAALTVTSITITAGNANFTENNNCAASLPVGTTASSTCTINVFFDPTALGPLTGTLTVKTNDPSNPTQTISLTGTGVPSGPAVATLNPAGGSTLAFGNQAVNVGSNPMMVTLTNTGGAPLTVSGISITQEIKGFTQTNNCSASLAVAFPAASCTINVVFTPTSLTSFSGTLVVTTNDQKNPTQNIQLSGTGVPGGAATLSATTVNFGDEVINIKSGPQSVTLTNSGSGPLSISSIVASGDYAQANTCPVGPNTTPLPANGTCTITITFTPTQTGTRNGSVVLTDNATNSPQTITLTGTGTMIGLAPGPGSSTTVTVNPGGTGVFGLILVTPPGTTGTATLSCSSPDASITCLAVPSTVNLTGKTVETAIVVNSYCTANTMPPNGPDNQTPLGRLPLYWLLGLCALAMFTLLSLPKTQRQRVQLAMAPALLAIVMMVNAACGNLPKSPTGAATPPGTYTLNITATLDNTSFTIPVTLIVK